MKLSLGTRVTVQTTLLVAAVLGLSSWAALYVRRSDLLQDLERHAREVAEALRAGIEPLDPALADEQLKERVWQARERDHAFQLEVLKVGDFRVTSPGWISLAERAANEEQPVGKHYPEGTRPFYALALPLYDRASRALPPRDPGKRPVAILGLRRDTGYIDDEVVATGLRTLPLLVGMVIFLAIGVHVTLRRAVIQPVRRLVDGIDAVGQGDLSRVLLAERDDELGTIANRFNSMTGSLREARLEAQRGVQARLALEARLRQSEKLATMGQMAAEIAHEVGTPLNVIGGRARSLTRKLGDPAEVEKNAGIIATQVDRITRIIKQVLDFSRKSGPTLTRVDVAAVVNEALAFIAETLAERHITAHLHAPPDLPDLPGDPDQIQQVCLNLFMNSVHAMPSGGRLAIAASQVIRRKEGLDLAAPAEYVMLEVGDTGTGIPPADRDKIFEPFFTTKDSGHGTGLGLSVSNGIVKDHDGWIEVGGRPQGGAVFRVYLPTGRPVAEDAPPAAMPAS